MKIAVLCWGSLFWDRGCLKIVGEKWNADGPELPLEFCRISSAGKPKERVTLVVYDEGCRCRTYWLPHETDKLEIAKANLACREGCAVKHIASIDKKSGPSDEITKTVKDWISGRDDVDAAIWTNLKGNWEEERGKPFSLPELEAYLTVSRDKEHWKNIEEYFTRSGLKNGFCGGTANTPGAFVLRAHAPAA